MAKHLKFSREELETEAAVMRTKNPHAVQSAEAVLATAIHSEVSQYEQDNVGVEGAHRIEETAEGSLRITAHHRRKAQHREQAHSEAGNRKSQNFHTEQDRTQNSSYAGDGTVRQPPRSKRASHNSETNSASKRQKRKVKKEASAKKAGTSETTSSVFSKAKEKVENVSAKAIEFVSEHKVGTIIAIVILVLGVVLYCLLSAGSLVAQGGSSVIGATTYPSADEDMLAAEAQYAGMEASLQQRLDNYESTHHYDEYHYELDEISHDPYVLISMLTALHHGAWTIDEVQSELTTCFNMQYTLTETVESETRTRTEEQEVEDPETEEITTEEVEVEYTYNICTVKFVNNDLSHIPIQLLSEEQLSLYAMYMTTLGNRRDLFPASVYISRYYSGDYLHYEIPPEALKDEAFAAMMAEATKYLGYPYVWGGASPSTSFDCSGYVSWVINHSGWNYGRLGAIGLCNICTPVSPANAKPGDLVFFKYTYAAEIPDGVTHVGIYVGNNMMIHCGDPIQYADLTSAYWSSHFYCYGRLPPP